MGSRYLLLVPFLPIFHLGLMMAGGMSLPFEFEILGRRVHELESLTIDGGKSLSNLIEIFIALAFGVIGCIALYLKERKNDVKKINRIVGLMYLGSVLLYILMPVLPE